MLREVSTFGGCSAPALCSLDTQPELDLRLVEALQDLGYRKFFSEQNVYCTTCYEIAFIHETLVQPYQYTPQ